MLKTITAAAILAATAFQVQARHPMPPISGVSMPSNAHVASWLADQCRQSVAIRQQHIKTNFIEHGMQAAEAGLCSGYIDAVWDEEFRRHPKCIPDPATNFGDDDIVDAFMQDAPLFPDKPAIVVVKAAMERFYCHR